MMYCIIEYHEKWCPEGDIISCWESKEECEEVFNKASLGSKTCTPTGKASYCIMSEKELVDLFESRMGEVSGV